MRCLQVLPFFLAVISVNVYSDIFELQVLYNAKSLPGNESYQYFVFEKNNSAANAKDQDTKSLYERQALHASMAAANGYEFSTLCKFVLNIEGSAIVQFRAEGVIPKTNLMSEDIKYIPELLWDTMFTQIFDGRDEYYEEKNLTSGEKLQLRYNDRNINDLSQGIAWLSFIMEIGDYLLIKDELDHNFRLKGRAGWFEIPYLNLQRKNGQFKFDFASNHLVRTMGNPSTPDLLTEWKLTSSTEFGVLEIKRILKDNFEQAFSILSDNRIDDKKDLFIIPQEAFLDDID